MFLICQRGTLVFMVVVSSWTWRIQLPDLLFILVVACIANHVIAGYQNLLKQQEGVYQDHLQQQEDVIELYYSQEVKRLKITKKYQGGESHALDISLLSSNNKNPKPSASPPLISSGDDHASDDACNSFK